MDEFLKSMSFQELVELERKVAFYKEAKRKWKPLVFFDIKTLKQIDLSSYEYCKYNDGKNSFLIRNVNTLAIKKPLNGKYGLYYSFKKDNETISLNEWKFENCVELYKDENTFIKKGIEVFFEEVKDHIRSQEPLTILYLYGLTKEELLKKVEMCILPDIGLEGYKEFLAHNGDIFKKQFYCKMTMEKLLEKLSHEIDKKKNITLTKKAICKFYFEEISTFNKNNEKSIEDFNEILGSLTPDFLTDEMIVDFMSNKCDVKIETKYGSSKFLGHLLHSIILKISDMLFHNDTLNWMIGDLPYDDIEWSYRRDMEKVINEIKSTF